MGKWNFKALGALFKGARKLGKNIYNKGDKFTTWIKSRPEYKTIEDVNDIYKAVKDRRFKYKKEILTMTGKTNVKHFDPKYMENWREDFIITKDFIEDYYTLPVHQFLPKYGLRTYISKSEFYNQNKDRTINEYLSQLEEKLKYDNNFILKESFGDKNEVPHKRYTGHFFMPSEKIDLTLPGHNYLGPGNNLEGKPVTNEADLIAKNHDYEYHESTHQKDISKSDGKAVKQFENTSGIGAFLGANILETKRLTEGITGNLYGAKEEFDYNKMIEGNIHTQIQHIKKLMDSEEKDYIDYENMYASYLREQEERQNIDKETANTLWDEEIKNSTKYDDDELVYRCTRTGLKCVQMFGKGKKGTELNKSQWEYKVSRAAYNKFRHLLGSDNREYHKAVQDYIIAQHETLAQNIGRQAYDQEFLAERRYVNLNNRTEKSIGAYSRSDEEHQSLLKTLQFINNNADEIFAAAENPDLVEFEESDEGAKRRKIIAEESDEEIEENQTEEELQNTPEIIEDSQPGEPEIIPETQMDNDVIMDSGVAGVDNATPAAGGGLGSGGGAGSANTARHTVFQSRGGASPSIFSWDNEFIMRTWGNATFMEMNPNTNKNLKMTYSLASLPTNHVSFYMPYTAYREMCNENFGQARILEVGYTVTPIGPTVAFNTNESTSAVAAPSHILYGYHHENINGKFPFDLVSIERLNNTMVLANVNPSPSASILSTRLWGYQRDLDSSIAAPQEIINCASNFGIVAAPFYTRIHHPPIFDMATIQGKTVLQDENDVRQNLLPGRIPLSNIIPTYTMKHFEQIAQPIISTKYKPKNPLNFARSMTNYFNLVAEQAVGILQASANFGCARHNLEDFNHPNENTSVIEATGHYEQVADNISMFIQGWLGLVRQEGRANSVGEKLNWPFREYENATIEGLYIDRSFGGAGKGSLQIPPQPVFGIHPVNGNTPQQAQSPINVSYDYKITTHIKAIRTYQRNGFNSIPFHFRRNGEGLIAHFEELAGIIDYHKSQLSFDPLWLIQTNVGDMPTDNFPSWTFQNKPYRFMGNTPVMNGALPPHTNPDVTPVMTRARAKRATTEKAEKIVIIDEFAPVPKKGKNIVK